MEGRYHLFGASCLSPLEAALSHIIGLQMSTMGANRAYLVENIRPGEQPAVCALAHTVFDEAIAPLFSQEGVLEFKAFAESKAMEQRARNSHRCFVVRDKEEILGMLELRTSDPVHVCLFFVKSDLQGKGIGRQLMSHAIRVCSETVDPQGSTLAMDVNASPNAVPMYQRLGFQIDGEEQCKNGIAFRHMVLVFSKSQSVDDPNQKSTGTAHSAEPVRPSRPEDWSTSARIRVLIMVSLCGLLPPFAGTLYIPSLVEIQRNFQTDLLMVSLTQSAYQLISAISQLFYGPLSDVSGRRIVLIVCTFLFAVGSALCSISWSIEALIGFRMVQAVGTGAMMVVGAGAIADVYPRKMRGRAMGQFALGPAIGTVIGPPVGGALSGLVGWTAVFWLLVVVSLLVMLGLIFFLPETLPPISSDARAPTEEIRLQQLGSALSSPGQPRHSMVPMLQAPSESSLDQDTGTPNAAGKERPSDADSLFSSVSVTDATMSIDDTVSSQDNGKPPLFLVRRQQAPAAARAPPKRTPWQALAQYGRLPIALTALEGSLNHGALLLMVTVLPVILTGTYGVEQVLIGLMFLPFTVVSVLSAPLGGWMTDRFGRARTMAASTPAVPVILLLIGWTFQFSWSLVLVSVEFGLLAFTMGALRVSTDTYALECNPSQPGAVTSSMRFGQTFMAAMATLGGAALMEAVDVGMTFTIVGALLLASAGTLIVYLCNSSQLSCHTRTDVSEGCVEVQ